MTITTTRHSGAYERLLRFWNYLEMRIAPFNQIDLCFECFHKKITKYPDSGGGAKIDMGQYPECRS